jgi:hypothetical protein
VLSCHERLDCSLGGSRRGVSHHLGRHAGGISICDGFGFGGSGSGDG